MSLQKIILSGCLILDNKDEILLLYRKDHQYYETPGGKVEANECVSLENPTIPELAKAAEREAYEELGPHLKLKKLKFFAKTEFTIPDGRLAVANKFVTKIVSGKPKVNEPKTFSRLDYLPIKELEKFSLSPDLKLLLPMIKSVLSHKSA